jgi:hypothetical protein
MSVGRTVCVALVLSLSAILAAGVLSSAPERGAPIGDGAGKARAPEAQNEDEEETEAAGGALPPDPVMEILGRIRDRSFESRAEVAMRGVLEDFDAKARMIDELDLARLRVVRHGPGWAHFDAPYVPRYEPAPEGTARMRFVAQDGRWKLERFRLLPQETDR